MSVTGACLFIALQYWVNFAGAGMPEEIVSGRERGSAEKPFGMWRTVAAAWAMAFIFVLLFAGVQALASRHGVSPREANLAGAIIPRHDPSCAGADDVMAPNSRACQDMRAAFEQAQENAYSGW
ncbi:MAG TPA: hypothetical protein VGP52_13515 [Stellaceae bacterium]|nr:hypothetical protein [Stellaceae bacterium]